MIFSVVKNAWPKQPANQTLGSSASSSVRPSSLDCSDEDLMLAYAQGRADAFEQLYGRYKGPLFRFIRNSVDSEVQSSEIFQDVWLRVVRSRESYKIDKPFKAWLYRIARNRTIDYYRQNAQVTEVLFEEDELPDSVSIEARQDEPEHVASMGERTAMLEEALKTLPVVQREAMLLHYVAGMTLKEIGDVVDVGTETVKSRLRYATTKIRVLLREVE